MVATPALYLYIECYYSLASPSCILFKAKTMAKNLPYFPLLLTTVAVLLAKYRYIISLTFSLTFSYHQGGASMPRKEDTKYEKQAIAAGGNAAGTLTGRSCNRCSRAVVGNGVRKPLCEVR